MAGPNEPNNETVRVDLPLPTPAITPEQNIKQTVRIQLPVRDARDAASPQFFRLPNPSSISTPSARPVAPVPDSAPLGPRKETARISSMPDPRPPTQPFAPMPEITPRNSVIAAASREKNLMLLWWVLLAVSALILIIQIWTYLS